MIAVARFTTNMDVLDVANRIGIAYPGTVVLSEDYYRDRLASLETLASEIGYDQNARPMQCFRDVASRVGLQFHLRIPITTDFRVEARIDAKGILVTGGDGIPELEKTQFLDLLARLPATIDLD